MAAATGLLDDRKRAPPGRSAETGVLDYGAAAATGSLGNGERAPSGGSAGAVAAATRVLDDGERARPGGSAEARAAATGGSMKASARARQAAATAGAR